MINSINDIVKSYTFDKKIAILQQSKFQRNSVIELVGHSAFTPIRNLVKNGDIKISSAKWLNDNAELGCGYAPNMLNESAYDNDVFVNYDLRSYTITITMNEEECFLKRASPRSQWKIQGTIGLFNRLIEDHINIRICERLSDIYIKECEKEKLKTMKKLCNIMFVLAEPALSCNP